jgi:MtfA peptidase
VGWFSRWRRARILEQDTLDPVLWQRIVARYPFICALSDEELSRLRELTILFLHEKQIHGAGGLAVRDEARVAIAAQACILVLNLGLDYYRGWVEVIVYPDEFVARYEYVDEAGVTHQVAEPMSGESWVRGPVILSWADAEASGRGPIYNVVIHEFAHKLDMLSGAADGVPPLHPGMDARAWRKAFAQAYEGFCDALERGKDTWLDPYAAEHPSEFFAVVSEAFFREAAEVRRRYPDVYDQLKLFYRQDPA